MSAIGGICFFNNAPDLAIDLLRELAEAKRLSNDVKSTRLCKMLRLRTARFLGRYRTVPDEQWIRAAGLFETIFGAQLAGGSDFYPQITAWTKEMAESN